jgi:(p)ppGpp synthase/HD superfamily hydrolase
MVNGSNQLEQAIAIACQAHLGQTDKAGEPYILHPLRVMLRLKSINERIVAVLHDVVEDSGVTLEDLRAHGFSREVLEAIDCLTRRTVESYEAFIDRIAVNVLATRVKIEDIKDNLDLTRLGAVQEGDLARARKYHRALSQLRAAMS